MTVRILEGDALTVLKTLPDESVQCCVTSPPYWGLRDYGTAQWEGGEVGCDHLGPPKASAASTLKNDGRPNPGRNDYEIAATVPFRNTCGKCGARRIDSQLGLEPTPEAHVAAMVAVFREVKRVLRSDGVLFLNYGDSYSNFRVGQRGQSVHAGEVHGQPVDRRRGAIGLKEKDLIGMPWRIAFALQADGWWLRQDIIWAKPNPMPESVSDRCTKAHEYIFLLTKAPRYYFDAEAIAEDVLPQSVERAKYPGRSHPRGWHSDAVPISGGDQDELSPLAATRNKRSVWTIATAPFNEAHFATFPPALVEPCIKAGSKPGDVILDPFFGAGTTGLVADRLGRDCIGIELNPQYAEMAARRIHGDAPLFSIVEEV